ncbi:MAG: SMC-Scp complex subunit ScpB [Myxococcota bacterium]|jgi:segregation and condensation protein B
MEGQRIKSVVESLLLVSERPITVKEMVEAIGETATGGLWETLEALKTEYESSGRGMRLREAAGGWQLCTPVENAEVIKNLLKMKPQKLSPAAMEVLAIISYRQPVTRPEIEEIRGVDCGGVLKVLLDRRLVRVLGKKDEVGRPFIYGTTKEFLEFFNLRDLSSLPTLKDFEQLSRELGESSGDGQGVLITGEAAEGEVLGAATAGESALDPAIRAARAVLEGAEEVDEVSEKDDPEGSALMEELTSAISRLENTRKDVIVKLGLNVPEQPEGEAAREGEPAKEGEPPAADEKPEVPGGGGAGHPEV